MARNQISLADQLKVIKYLRKNPAVVGEGCKDIAKRAGEALEMQLTPINISTCMKAIGMTTSKAEARTKKIGVAKKDLEVLAQAIFNLYQYTGRQPSEEFTALAKRLSTHE